MKQEAEMSQYEKIVTLMVRKHVDITWWSVKDFMQVHLGDLFVGYEAGSRLSELASKYPDIFAKRDDPEYKNRKQYAIKLENKESFFNMQSLPFREVLIREMSNAKLLEVDIF